MNHFPTNAKVKLVLNIHACTHRHTHKPLKKIFRKPKEVINTGREVQKAFPRQVTLDRSVRRSTAGESNNTQKWKIKNQVATTGILESLLTKRSLAAGNDDGQARP